MANQKFKVGSKVEWKWLGRAICGEVVEVFTEPVVKEIKSKKIKRNGSPENPAYLVKSEAGNLALKLGSELQAPSKASKKPKPSLFS